jgi:phosphotransferase system  glucose/maltose/N-acetylglucosamine-specific IIC component
MLNMLFLYFPEDKTEYIPAIIVMLLFMVLAGFAFYLVRKKSKKDEAKFNEKYAEQLKEAEEAGKEHQHS